MGSQSPGQPRAQGQGPGPRIPVEVGVMLGPPVAPFCPFFGFGGPLLNPKSRKKGALIVRDLLGYLGWLRWSVQAYWSEVMPA